MSVFILGTFLDYECAIETKPGDSLIAWVSRVFPFHNVTFQPTVLDDAGDHAPDHAAWIASLHCAEVHCKGVFRANEVVISLERDEAVG